MSNGVLTPVVCQNMMPGPTVIAADIKGTYEVRFDGKGDPSGGDVQRIPPEVVATVQFANAIAKGILRVEEGAENEVVAKALERQTDAFWGRAKTERDEALATLDAPAENDMIAVACIGPGTRTGASCDEQIPVRAREAGSIPPLCQRHAGLADQCVKRGREPWKLETA
jgi:hypothetical protein